MGLRFLIVNTDYPSYIRTFYAQNPELESQSYEEQFKARMDSLFGVADFYSSNLKKLGHEARDILANHEPLQFAWAREHGMKVTKSYRLRFGLRRGLVPWLVKDRRWVHEILMAQVREYKPDIFYNIAMDGISNDFMREVKPYVKLVIGQHAAPLPAVECYDAYDLVVSSLPNLVDYFNASGIPSELFKFGFEPRLLLKLKEENSKTPIVHVGGYGRVHQERNILLEKLAESFEIKFWGYGIQNLPKDSPIRRSYCGEAWGLKMYHVRYNSRMTINKHITAVAGRYCNNMSLYEATGVGTLLVTDYKDNLHEIFVPDKEVIAYHDADDCAEKIDFYLSHEDERAKIAQAGQQRTLTEHTYFYRMQELVEIVRKYL